jgi:hypothetical protein
MARDPSRATRREDVDELLLQHAPATNQDISKPRSNQRAIKAKVCDTMSILRRRHAVIVTDCN